MQTDLLYDTDSVMAHCRMRDLLMVAAREQLLHEARNSSHRRDPIVEVGHLLVRLGYWLQAMAHHPTYQEETVQW